MKIAVTGKGGVGKTTVAAALALLCAGRNIRVLALDADPDSNFASALGFPPDLEIIPISKRINLIEERTGAKIDEYGKVFKLNPEVSDVAERFAVRHNGIDLLVLGAASRGGNGCACPENAFIKALVTDLILYKDETLIIDMEAGVEHLGRATASGVDVMAVVVEPGLRSIVCAKSVTRMAKEIGIKKFVYVANKITSRNDESFIRDSLGPDMPVAVAIPYGEAIRASDRPGVSALYNVDEEMRKIFESLMDVVYIQ